MSDWRTPYLERIAAAGKSLSYWCKQWSVLTLDSDLSEDDFNEQSNKFYSNMNKKLTSSTRTGTPRKSTLAELDKFIQFIELKADKIPPRKPILPTTLPQDFKNALTSLSIEFANEVIEEGDEFLDSLDSEC